MTVEYVEAMHDKWLNFDHGEYTIEEIIAGPRTIHGIVQFKVKWEDWPLEKAGSLASY